MKIYTRQGDEGQTRLLSGDKVEKDDPRVKTYGALDEFQSHLGFAKSLIRVESISSLLDEIQEDIFVASSELASTPKTLTELKYRIAQEDVKRLETWIDKFTATYGLPDGFIIPGNSSDSAAVHVARSVCRRCERLLVMLKRQHDFDSKVLLVYFNRLSDLLFVLAWALEIRAVISEVIQELIGRNSGEKLKP
jgi:ATP:cob(I)alamin adenosyltransferase